MANSLDAPCVNKFLELLRQEHHHLLPQKLNKVYLEDAFDHAEDEERFWRSLGKEEGIFFPSTVEELAFCTEHTIQAFASALSRGAAPGVNMLAITGEPFRDDDMTTLSQVFLTTPYGEQLKELELHSSGHWIGSLDNHMNYEGVLALSNAIAAGCMPKLTELCLGGEILEPEHFGSALTLFASLLAPCTDF